MHRDKKVTEECYLLMKYVLSLATHDSLNIVAALKTKPRSSLWLPQFRMAFGLLSFTALKAVNVSSATVSSGELEAEGGCLIDSVDIQMPGKKSIVEVTVDAGTGKVLAQKHESPKAQAAEKAADAAGAAKK